MKLGWPQKVNKIIIDSTTLDLGEGAVETEVENGKIETWLKSSCVPEVINVTMDFDFFEKDENGFSEFDRFNRWFKFKHKYGTVPFEFPTVYKTGRNATSLSTYKIKGSPKFQKRGLCQRTTMVWEEEFKEVINIPNTELSVIGGFVENGILTLMLNEAPSEEITTDTFKISLFFNGDEVPIEIKKTETDEDKAIFYFTPVEQTGTYSFSVENFFFEFEVA